MDDEKDIRHPSFGLVSIGRASTSGATLFDSPFRHQHIISMAISTASKRRSLHSDSLMGEKELIRVDMSEVQFATMLTSPNMGHGTPCTISRFNGKSIDRPPQENVRETYSKEIKAEFKDLLATAKELDELTNRSAWNASDKKRMRDLSGTIERAFDDNLAFFQRQFEQKMASVVASARAEVEAHVESVIRRTGLEQLREEALRLEGPSEEKEVPNV